MKLTINPKTGETTFALYKRQLATLREAATLTELLGRKADGEIADRAQEAADALNELLPMIGGERGGRNGEEPDT